MPASMIATMRSDVPTGRRIKMRDGFTGTPPQWPIGGCSAATLAALVALLLAPVLSLGLALMRPGLLRSSRGAAAGATCRAPAAAACLAQQHLGAVLQLISAVDDDALTRGEPLGDRDVDGVACAECHLAHRHGLIGGVDDVDVGARSAALHAGLRNECRALQRIEQQH